MQKSLHHCLFYLMLTIFIGPESDHWLCLSLTHSLTNSLTNSCLVNLIDVSLASEDCNSKLAEVVSLVDVALPHQAGIELSDFHARVWKSDQGGRNSMQ